MIHLFYFLQFTTDIIQKDIPEFYGEPFHNLVIDLHRKYDSINILLKRGETVHNDDERFQDYEKSLEIDKLCKKILEENNVPYHEIQVGLQNSKKIIKLLGKSK